MDKRVKDNYLIGIDELNFMIPISILTAFESHSDVAGRAAAITEDVLSFLIKAYREGAQATAIMLGIDVEIDDRRMAEVIYALIDDMTFEDRIYQHVAAGDEAALERLIDSEYHRVYCTAGHDMAADYVKNGGGAGKIWHTMLDDRVRDTHDYLEGMSAGFDEEFFTYDGDSARFPGDFHDPANNVGCRCFIEYVIEP